MDNERRALSPSSDYTVDTEPGTADSQVGTATTDNTGEMGETLSVLLKKLRDKRLDGGRPEDLTVSGRLGAGKFADNYTGNSNDENNNNNNIIYRAMMES